MIKDFTYENGRWYERLSSGELVEIDDAGNPKYPDFAKDWESYYSPPHTPQCDCGGEKTGGGHSHWCSIKEERL